MVDLGQIILSMVEIGQIEILMVELRQQKILMVEMSQQYITHPGGIGTNRNGDGVVVTKVYYGIRNFPRMLCIEVHLISRQ